MWAVKLGLSGAGGPAAEGVGRAGNLGSDRPVSERPRKGEREHGQIIDHGWIFSPLASMVTYVSMRRARVSGLLASCTR